MGVMRRNSFRYDGKALWDYYMSLGKAANYPRVMKYAVDSGLFNPLTGRVTKKGVRYAMWRYAFEHPEEAYESFRKWQMEFGEYPTFREFCEEVFIRSETIRGEIAAKGRRQAFSEKYLSDA